MRFVDEVEITVSSGTGGNGHVAFRRESKVPRGGPSGGDGGRGGSVIFRATRMRNTLVDFRWSRIIRAQNGERGMDKDMYGRAADDSVLLVPLGTMLHDAETGELVADLNTDGAEWRLEGGRGGRGNIHFATPTRRTPEFAEEGKPGEERKLRLELKILADVGLLGYPNAGKSTLISRMSAARPKIADYPFTTLHPNLGVVSVGVGESYVVADIPGLIEGASEGKGLGHQFLKHVERCALYLHLVSCEEGPQSPLERLRAIDAELLKYDEDVANREQIVVLTKCDIIDEESRDALVAELAKATGRRVIPISAVAGLGLKEVTFAAWQRVKERRDAAGTNDVSEPPTL